MNILRISLIIVVFVSFWVDAKQPISVYDGLWFGRAYYGGNILPNIEERFSKPYSEAISFRVENGKSEYWADDSNYINSYILKIEESGKASIVQNGRFKRDAKRAWLVETKGSVDAGKITTKGVMTNRSKSVVSRHDCGFEIANSDVEDKIAENAQRTAASADLNAKQIVVSIEPKANKKPPKNQTYEFKSPDEEILGKSIGYPLPSFISFPWAEQYKVAVFSNRDKLSPHCTIPASGTPLALKEIDAEPSFSYAYGGRNLTVDNYMSNRRITGLLILKDDQIQIERYAYGRTADQRMLSNSMAKTIVGLAVGQALSTGSIRSLEDSADTYVPELKGSLYGEAKIINLLRMSSGVKFTENYSGNDDLAKFGRLSRQDGIIKAIKAFDERATEPGAKFKYSGTETHVLAQVIQSATKQHLCDYVSENIWKKIGAENNATWLYQNSRKEVAASGEFNSTLRDFGRLGYALANNGVVMDEQVFNGEYLLNMTDVSRQPRAFRPKVATPYFGYGFQTWLLDSPTGQRRFLLAGIYGQAIFVDPENRIVMVQTAVDKAPAGTGILGEAEALFRAVVMTYSKW